MKKEVEGICDEHFVLKNNDGEISIYRMDENNNEIFVSGTGIIIKYLPESDKEKIEEGIYVAGSGELNKLLENFE